VCWCVGVGVTLYFQHWLDPLSSSSENSLTILFRTRYVGTAIQNNNSREETIHNVNDFIFSPIYIERAKQATIGKVN
jgi:hypothetical protein